MNFRILLGLIVCNLIWSFHPVMAKQILTEFPPAQTALLRYGSALLTFLLAALIFRIPRPFAIPRGGATSGMDRFWIVVLGLSTFMVAPFFQMVGIASTRATDSSLITALEPLVAVAMAWVFIRERLDFRIILAFVFALTGFGLLSDLTWEKMGGGWDPRLIGNALLLGSAAIEGLYSVLGRKLVHSQGALPLFGSALLVGVLALSVAVVVATPGGLGGFHLGGMSVKTIGAVLWIGPIGTCAGYLYWMQALKSSTVATLAVTLFIQPLCGALWGYLFMGDRLTSTQATGGVLILLAVLVPVLISGLRKSAKSLVTSG